MAAASLGHTGLAEAELENWKDAESLLTRALELYARLGVQEDAAGMAVFREKLAACREVLREDKNA